MRGIFIVQNADPLLPFAMFMCDLWLPEAAVNLLDGRG